MFFIIPKPSADRALRQFVYALTLPELTWHGHGSRMQTTLRSPPTTAAIERVMVNRTSPPSPCPAYPSASRDEPGTESFTLLFSGTRSDNICVLVVLGIYNKL